MSTMILYGSLLFTIHCFVSIKGLHKPLAYGVRRSPSEASNAYTHAPHSVLARFLFNRYPCLQNEMRIDALNLDRKTKYMWLNITLQPFDALLLFPPALCVPNGVCR